jgi:hypothetical protein
MQANVFFRALLLLSPALLSGCGAVDLASIPLLWEDSAPKSAAAPVAIALRSDEGDVPAGTQVDDLQAPFGAGTPTQTASIDTSRTRQPR